MGREVQGGLNQQGERGGAEERHDGEEEGSGEAVVVRGWARGLLPYAQVLACAPPACRRRVRRRAVSWAEGVIKNPPCTIRSVRGGSGETEDLQQRFWRSEEDPVLGPSRTSLRTSLVCALWGAHGRLACTPALAS